MKLQVWSDTRGHHYIEMIPGDGKLVRIERERLSSTFGLSLCVLWSPWRFWR